MVSSSLKYFFCLVLLYSSVRAQIDLYTPDEFTTLAPNGTLCSSTLILGDLVVRPLNFSWSLDYLNYVNWTYQGLFYPVLGSIQCPRGQGLIYEGVWKCNDDSSKTGDLLARLECPASQPEPVFPAPGVVACAADNDTLGMLACPAGYLIRASGNAWVCSPDNNYLSNATAGCVAGQLLRYVDGRWQCFNALLDSDTLRSLIPTCTNNFIPKFISGVWVCARDNDTLGNLNCAAGSRLQRSIDGTTWICGPKEQDTFRDIGNNCTGNRDTPFLTPTGWDCIPTPAINNSIFLGTILYEWSLTLQRSGSASTSSTSQLQPYFLPYRGQLRGFQLHVSPTGPTNITANLFLNNNLVNSVLYNLGNSNVTYNINLAIPFTASSTVSFTISAGNLGGGYVTVGVFAQVSAFP